MLGQQRAGTTNHGDDEWQGQWGQQTAGTTGTDDTGTTIVGMTNMGMMNGRDDKEWGQ